jgi:hypothetical protein
MIALLLLIPITLASAKSASTQSIVFVNNSINEPAFDSFIQIDATAPPKLLDTKVVQPALPAARTLQTLSITPVQLLLIKASAAVMLTALQVSSSFDYVSGGTVCDGWYEPLPMKDDACVLKL